MLNLYARVIVMKGKQKVRDLDLGSAEIHEHADGVCRRHRPRHR